MGQYAILRAGWQPALDGHFASVRRRVTNPPQVANLLHKRLLLSLYFASLNSLPKTVPIVGRTPWSARVPLDPLFATGSTSYNRGRPAGGLPRTVGGRPAEQNSRNQKEG